ncbi:MAG: hypothetical protein J6O51_06635 [Bacteroidales bacterium]|nr:hypothetical protein [Bacteroidales bacterium]
MKLKFLFIVLLSTGVLFSCSPTNTEEPDNPGTNKPEPAPEPEPEPEPVKHVDPVSLSFVSKNVHDIDMSYDESAGEWLLTTTGADPYIFTAGLEKDLELEHRVLNFDYRCNAGVNDLQVFYGKSIAESRSRHFGAIPATSGNAWKNYSCSIAADRNAFSWGKAGENLRLDFGTKKNVVLHIKNFQIREMNEEELKAYEAELQKAKGKDAEAERIAAYVAKSYPCRVSSVEVGDNEVTIKGHTDGGSGYYIAEIGPWESLTEVSSFSQKVAISGNSFSVSMPRTVSRDNLPEYDRVLSRFAVVKVDGASQTLCSHARYADDIKAVRSPAALVPKSKKGLGAFVVNNNLSDLDDLGISSVTVNIVLNSMVNTERSGNYVTPWKFGGITYYMNTGYASQLDRILTECRKRGIVVSAILLNRQSDTNSKATALLKHPECDGGNYSMPNLTTAAAANLYAAVLDYLAGRYSTDTYGRIHHWILHNEVDFQKEWTNMGDQPEWRYMDSYVRSMRICHNIAHKYDPNSTVMISLTHAWAKAEGQYASKSLLEDLCKYSSAEGDFLWGIAYHPYPQDLTRPEFWKDDTSSTYSLNSSFCTFKNLEVVNAWVLDKQHYFKGKSKRLLFLSENGTNSPSYSESDLAKQAAGAAWAWKKTNTLEGIDGIQWHNWQDNRAEGGLRIGLRRFPDDSEQPNGKKPAWYVWQAAGTSSEDSVFAPYLTTIGVSSWSEIIGTL